MDTRDSGTDNLTAQEAAVLDALDGGRTNAEAAAELGRSVDAVKADVVSALRKMGVRSREEAVEAWAKKQRRARRMRRLGVGVAAVVGIVLLYGIGSALFSALTSDSDAEDDVRVLIPTILAPAPGFSVFELPSGEERTFARSGVVTSLTWSPTRTYVIARFEQPEGRLAFVSYKSGATKIFDAGAEWATSIDWSPDGEMVVVAAATRLDRDASTDSATAFLLHADGTLAATIASGEVLDQSVPETDWTLSRCVWGWSLDSQSFAISLFGGRPRVFDRNGTLASVVADVDECGELVPLWFSDLPPFSSDNRDDLDAIERSVPDGYVADPTPESGLSPINNPRRVEGGWTASLRRGSEHLTLISVRGTEFQFDGSLDGRYPIVAGLEAEALDYPETDVTGCPMAFPSWCQVGVHVANSLFAGDVDTVLEFAAARVEACRHPDPADERACVSERTGLVLPTFIVEDEDGSERSVSPLEFRLILDDLARRIAAASNEARDEYGDGVPRIVSVTCGRWEGREPPEFGCNSPRINVTWIDGDQRVVVGLGPLVPGVSGVILRGEGSGYELALNGGQEQPGSTLTRRRAVLWKPPGAE